MRRMKKPIKVLSIVHMCIWIFLLIIVIVEKGRYVSSANGEPLDIYLSNGIYNIFIVLAIAGINSSLLLVIAIDSLIKMYCSSMQNVKNRAVVVAVISNVLFYTFIVSLCCIKEEWILIIPIIWLLSLILGWICVMSDKRRVKC